MAGRAHVGDGEAELRGGGLERTLRLPPYYGHNLDALYDCLGDLSQNVNIILINGDLLDANLGEYAARLRTVFTDAAKVPFAFRFFENPS